MSQGALSVANGPGGTVRSNFNAAIARLATRASGTGRPSDIATGENWIETDNPGAGIWSEWKYDGSNDILVRLINSTSHTIAPASVTTTKGDLIKRGTSADARFGVGTAHYLLGTNSAGDDLEWKLPGYVRLAADAVPVSAANVSFTSIPSTVKSLRFIGNLLNATDNVNCQMQFSQSSTFATGASAYNYAYIHAGSGGSAPDAGGANATNCPLNGVSSLSNSSTNGGVAFDVVIPDVQATFGNARAIISGDFFNQALTSHDQIKVVARLAATGAIDGVRFLFSSGNISLGRIMALALMA